MMKLYEPTVHEVAASLRSRELSSVELTRAYLERIAAGDPLLYPYLTVIPDETLATGEVGPLTGIPIALKDALVTEGVETTAGSRMLKGYVPPYSATVVERLRRGGAIVRPR
jgi:aspartyl-tRNA(Asn)/glutamyl-tRNA(Gln) amidotransferase subunit A